MGIFIKIDISILCEPVGYQLKLIKRSFLKDGKEMSVNLKYLRDFLKGSIPSKSVIRNFYLLRKRFFKSFFIMAM